MVVDIHKIPAGLFFSHNRNRGLRDFVLLLGSPSVPFIKGVEGHVGTT